MPETIPTLIFTLGIVISFGVGFYIRYLQALSKKTSIEIEIKEKLVEAEKKVIDILERAEVKVAKIEEEARADKKTQEEKLAIREEYLLKREEVLDTRQMDLDSQKEAIQDKIIEIKSLKNRLDERKQEIDKKLEEVAGYSRDEAYKKLMVKIEGEYAEDLQSRVQKIERLGSEYYEDKARDILLAAIHRIGNNIPPNIMLAHVEISKDDLKGKIIGKEGRNIRAFERITGVDVLVDDTPGYIILSSFDPIRREIARVAMEELLEDGRIQPAKIEEAVEKARKEVSKIIKAMGEKACYDANVPNLHPDLISILGRLHFRTSYGQNVLWHSVEMAHLAAIIAEEVGADVAIARAGALLHDIGKTVSHEVAGTHVEIGIRILQKYNVDEKVILAMRAHHEEYPYETPESIIVQVADAISGGRPGARSDSVENYIKRLSELELIATASKGVLKAFAIAAGREIRVIVNPEALNDFETHTLAKTIANNIEGKLHYPGEIKVHVIRETRVISYAR